MQLKPDDSNKPENPRPKFSVYIQAQGREFTTGVVFGKKTTIPDMRNMMHQCADGVLRKVIEERLI